ncbi:hypothetical protein PCE1_004529 [Barthelona sp. PCE]
MEGRNLIAVIGDESTVTGCLLAGVGEKFEHSNETNYLIVTNDTKTQEIENTFRSFTRNPVIAVVMITKDVAQRIQMLIDNYEGVEPVVTVL